MKKKKDTMSSKQASLSSDKDITTTKQDTPTRLSSSHKSSCSVHEVLTFENLKVNKVWAFLLALAVCAIIIHLYSLCKTFSEHKKQIQMELAFDSLQFPAVTICNINPIRKSKAHLASETIEKILDLMVTDSTSHKAVSTDGLTRKDSTAPNIAGVSKGHFQVWESLISTMKKKLHSLDFADQVFRDKMSALLNHYMTDKITNGQSWRPMEGVSALTEMSELSRLILVSLNRTTRVKVGHQLSDMLMQCSFSGRTCYSGDFKRVFTSKYGNCYTLQNPKFISHNSGPVYGLKLQLYLQTEEYIPYVADSVALQVVVHDENTIPFPDTEGFMVMAGRETAVGLRRVETTRYYRPNDQCVSKFSKAADDDLSLKGPVKYTRIACQDHCQQAEVKRRCNCYDALREVNVLVFEHVHNESVRACTVKDDLRCALDTMQEIEKNGGCKCHSSCRREFVKLDIYYEDLNYKVLKETTNYQFYQFVSDVGGAFDFWAGLSILSMLELVHLMWTLIVRHWCKH